MPSRAERIAEVERAILKSYGGMYHFMLSFGLKMYKDGDLDEAKAILRTLAEGEVDGE